MSALPPNTLAEEITSLLALKVTLYQLPFTMAEALIYCRLSPVSVSSISSPSKMTLRTQVQSPSVVARPVLGL